MDIKDTEGGLLVKMELAGTRADDLQVSLSPDDRVLTISGTRGEAAAVREGRVGCHQLEIYFGPFERSLSLPPGVPLDRDRITASYRDGFLLVTLPKRSPREPMTRLIPINAGEAVPTRENEDNR